MEEKRKKAEKEREAGPVAPTCNPSTQAVEADREFKASFGDMINWRSVEAM